jgi:HSP20 family protein
MNVTRANSFLDLNNILNGFYQPTTTKKAEVYSPRVDIIEHEDNYQLIAELAGISKSDISITVNDSVLTIAAESKPNTEESSKVLRRERQFGKFERSFKVGENIEQENIAASFKDGILYLTVPKLKPVEPTVRNIEIH